MGLYESPVDFGDFDVQMVLIQKANLSKSDSKHRKSPKIWIMIVIMVRVFSTHFEKNKGQKVKLKGHQYSFLAALRVFIRVASTHFWPQQGFFKGSSSTRLQPLICAKEIDLQKKFLIGRRLRLRDEANNSQTRKFV